MTINLNPCLLYNVYKILQKTEPTDMQFGFFHMGIFVLFF